MRGARWSAALALVLTLAGGAAPTRAAELPGGWALGAEPLQVDARSLDARGAENRVVFEGDVVARQGELTLQADWVEVVVDPVTREIQAVKARGNVRVQKAEIVAAGREGTYDARTGVVVLTGEPKVWRERDVVAGEKITLFLAENRSVVEGARAVIYPGKAPIGERR